VFGKNLQKCCQRTSEDQYSLYSQPVNLDLFNFLEGVLEWIYAMLGLITCKKWTSAWKRLQMGF